MSRKGIKKLTADQRDKRLAEAAAERLRDDLRSCRETVEKINGLERWCDFPTLPEIRPGEGVAGYLRRVLAEVEADTKAELAREVADETFRRGIESSAPVDPATDLGGMGGVL